MVFMYITYLFTYVYEFYEYELNIGEIPDQRLLHNELEEYTGEVFNEVDDILNTGSNEVSSNGGATAQLQQQ